VKILAEPTLIALSGHKASFHAGGEFPIPVVRGAGHRSIELQGVRRKAGTLRPPFWRTTRSTFMSPEVSELDFSSAGSVRRDFVIPGLSTRTAETVVELGDGQSFAIAGLLRESVRDAASKFPLLGDIPILGALFRSKAFQKSETELIIIATPRLVKPVDTAIRPLPTDYYIEPNDAEFYLLGRMEGGTRGGRARGELDGEFGHAMPARR
jgi:pilus assembly protein CpaC